jgi:hypothetical protein
MVRQAAIKANAHIFIREMKDQYDTEAGEKGAQLSGVFSSDGLVNIYSSTKKTTLHGMQSRKIEFIA